ncbi:DPH3-like protein, partial [Mucuna pruriens]
MSYDDVEIEDMEWNEEMQAYTYPCPCGDLFQITKEDLKLGEEIARCPSCSLYITVIYNIEDFLTDSDQNRRNKALEPSKHQPLTIGILGTFNGKGRNEYYDRLYYSKNTIVCSSEGKGEPRILIISATYVLIALLNKPHSPIFIFFNSGLLFALKYVMRFGSCWGHKIKIKI